MWQSIIASFKGEHPHWDVIPERLPMPGTATKRDPRLVAGEAPEVLLFQDEPFPHDSAAQFSDLSPFISGGGSRLSASVALIGSGHVLRPVAGDLVTNLRQAGPLVTIMVSCDRDACVSVM